MKKPAIYEVTLRRDVQQVARFHIEAASQHEAIDTAESACDVALWDVEKHIGTHRSEARILKVPPVTVRESGKSDRRNGTDRRYDKRRLGDKSRELLAARRKKPSWPIPTK